MTQVTFYVLGESQSDWQLFTCRLLETAYKKGSSVFVYAPDESFSDAINQRLWTFSQNAFVPHDLEDADPQTPVMISADPKRAQGRTIALNLNLSGTEVPTELAGFERVIEIVPSEDGLKAPARSRFSAWRKQGITPETHNIK